MLEALFSSESPVNADGKTTALDLIGHDRAAYRLARCRAAVDAP